MGENSKISWTNDTWNPWMGCKKISSGCKYCYMFRQMKRYGRDPHTIKRASDSTFNAPLKKLHGPLIFTCSWSDFFLKEADQWRADAWDIIHKCPHLTFQILTKRPENILDRLPDTWADGWPNVWLGVTVEHQDYINRVDILRSVPSALRFISAEPLLGPLNLDLTGYSWLITGGESGTPKKHRPAQTQWFRDIRDTCIQHNIPYFHKQNGGDFRLNGIWGGDSLDLRTWHQIPPHSRGDQYSLLF